MQSMKRISIFSVVALGAWVAILPIACRSTSDVYTLPAVPPSDREGKPPPPVFVPKEQCPPHRKDQLEPCFEQAVLALKKGQPEYTREVLKEIREQYPKTLWATRAAFVLGKIALDDQSGEALDLLKQASDLPLLKDYALFYQADAYRQARQLSEAVNLYDKLLSNYPGSLLVPEATYRRAVILAETGDCTGALAGFESYVATYPSDPQVPDALLKSADCSLKLGEPTRAIKALRRIWAQYSDHDVAAKAEEAVAQIQAGGTVIPEPTNEERYQRGQTLFEAARYEEALIQFRALSRDPAGPDRDEAAVKMAMALIQLKRYEEARRVLEDYIAQFGQTRRSPRVGRGDLPSEQREREGEAPSGFAGGGGDASPSNRSAPTANSQLKTQNSKWLLQALIGLARIAVRQSNEGRLLDIEKRLADSFPQSPERAQVLLLIGGFYEDQKQPVKAAAAYQKIRSELARDSAADEALWRIGWMAYTAGRFEEAIQTFSSYSNARFNGEYQGQFLYWTGRSAENLGRSSEAVTGYEEVCAVSPRTYYCMMAEERLARLKLDPPQTDQEAAQSVAVIGLPVLFPNGSPDALLQDTRYQTAGELMVLGLDQEAAREFNGLTERYTNDRPALMALAGSLYRAGDYYRSLRLIRLYFWDVLQKDTDAVPTGFWELAFPLRLVDLIRDHAPRGAADPYVVAAVMREESAFDPKAVSKTGALGLMQLMPFTGQWVARQLGEPVVDADQLFDPKLNIRLGSWYLGHLARQFDSNLILSIASYNAGPEAVARWVQARPPQPDALDEFIESIPFSETRSFTKRVLRSYTEYLRLAGLEAPRRFSRPILLP
jgi:soluble lytic murein transglycosylase